MPPRILGQTPFGVVVEKSDGSQLVVPHGIARQVLGPLLAQNGPAPDAPTGDVSDAPAAPDAPLEQPPAPPGPTPAAPMFQGVGSAPPPAAAPSSPGTPPAPAGAPPLSMANLAPQQPPDGPLQLKMEDLGQRPGAPAPRSAGASAGAAPDPGKLLLQTGQDASSAALASGDAQARGLAEAGPKMEAAAKTAIAANTAARLDFENYMGKVEQRSAALGQEIAALSQQKINPEAYMQGLSAGGKLATLAGIIAGGFVSTVTGGRNEATETVKGLIAQNIQGQVANLENARGLAHDKMTMLQQDVLRGMDINSARTKATAVGLEQAAKLIEAEGAKYQSDAIRAKAAEEAAKLREEAAKTYASWRAQQAQTYASIYATNSENRRFALGLDEKAREADQKARQEQGKLAVPAIAFSSAFDPSTGGHTMKVGQGPAMYAKPDSIKEARELTAHTAAAMKSVQRYLETIKENRGSRGGVLASPEYQKMQEARGDAFVNIFKLKFQRAPTKLEQDEVIDQYLPPPQGLLNIADPYARLHGALASIADAYNSQGPTYFDGFQPIASPANGKAEPPGAPPPPADIGAGSGRLDAVPFVAKRPRL